LIWLLAKQNNYYYNYLTTETTWQR